MSQVTITNFFNKRKRQVDDLKSRSKVLVLEREEYVSFKSIKTDGDIASIQSNTVKDDSESVTSNCKSKLKSQTGGVSTGKQKVVRFDESKNTVRVHVFQKRSASKSRAPKYDIRKSFKNAAAKIASGLDGRENDSETENLQHQETVVAEEGAVHLPLEDAAVSTQQVSGPELAASGSGMDMRAEPGLVTPTKKIVVEEPPLATALEDAAVSTNQVSGPELAAGGSGVDMTAEYGLMTPTKKAPQDLSLSEIKSRLSRSEKLRQAMSSFSKAAAKCAKLEAARKELDKTGPQLQNFDKVEVEFCTSPQKGFQRSPEKRVAVTPDKRAVASPDKRAVGSPLKTSGLPLPFGYRSLAEVFRCVDVVVSMMYNRSEAVTFKKVKAAVQEMMHRTFTEHHLGLIKAVFPDAYIFHQEKLRNFGSTSKADTYELTITPVLHTNSKNETSLLISDEEVPKQTDKVTMTPTCILERKRTFYNNLLERVFEQHEKFLSSLDPPMLISREELVRWHPQFEVDAVEEIVPQELPQPPNVKKFTSAKDVLDRAKDLFSCNPRMQNVLKEMSGCGSQSGSQSAVSSNKDKDISPVKQESRDTLHSALKGIPKSLLEKVRARQAARARLTMTCPAQDKESVEHSRLPELARILRNVFVTEKKVALPLETVTLKLQNSYREKLSARELEHHIQLMVNLVPGWLVIHSIRNTDYLKMSRNGDITKVIQKLEATALEKKSNPQVLKPS